MSKQTVVEHAFLRSLSVAISIASLILAVAEDSFFPAGLTPFIALGAHLLIDRYRIVSVSISVANVLGSLAFIAMAFEFLDSSLLGKLMAGSHLLVYITWVVLLLPKGIRQFWWIMALAVLQVAVASVLTDESSFGLSTFGLMFVMIWTLSLFTLFRTQLRFLATSTTTDTSVTVQDSLNVTSASAGETDSDLVVVENGLQVDSDEQWVGWRFRGVVATAFLSSVCVALITFLIFPRIWVPESPLAGFTQSVQEALSSTGFTETVALGDIGDIMQSDARVLQFRITSMLNRRDVLPDDFAREVGMEELLFRGNTMGLYEDGMWDSGRPGGRSMAEAEGEASLLQDPTTADFRMEVTQDPPGNSFAFAPAPLRNIVENSADLNIDKLRYSSTIRVKSSAKARAKPLKFEAWFAKSPQGQNQHSPDLARPLDETMSVLSYFSDPLMTLKNRRFFAQKWCMTPNLKERLPELSRIANELCSEDGKLVSKRERLNRVFRYLNTSGEFSYSLSPRIDDYSIDPVEDFLLNQKKGHCEYFASAYGLMVQAVGLPARIVTGYKGFEENTVNGHFEVKQKHAHSWVEVWIEDHWETVDPTPAAARNASVQEPRPFAWWIDLKVVMNDGWQSMVQKMNPEQQKKMIQPILDSIKQQWRTAKSQGVWKTLKLFVTDFLMQPEKWFSLTTLLVTFFVLLVPGLIFRRNPFAWIRSKLRAATRWARGDEDPSQSVVRFYETFSQVCRKHGLVFPEQQTAVENAQQAAKHFAGVLTAEQDRRLPLEIADAFNAVRFGNAQLPAEQLQRLRDDVSRFNVALKAATHNRDSSAQSQKSTKTTVS